MATTTARAAGSGKSLSLQTKFVLTFLILLIIVLGSFLIYVNWLVIRPLQESYEAGQRQTAANVSSQLDLYISGQNQLTQRVLANQEVFAVMANVNRATLVSDKLARSRKLTGIMFSALGPSMNIRDMYVHDLEGTAIASFIGYDLNQVSLAPLLDDPETGEALRSGYVLTRGPSGEIAFIRPIVNQNGEGFGYLTVQLDELYLRKPADGVSAGDVVVVDGDHGIITASAGVEADELAQGLRAPDGDSGMYVDAEDNYVAYHQSAMTGWTTYILSPERAVLGPVNSVKYISIALLSALLLFSALYIYVSAKNLLLPIRKLRNQLLRITYSNMNVKVDSRSHNNELLLLDAAFRELLERLQQSIEREKQAVREEASARSSALQAQIAPHFIHNVLYLISVAAQEGKNTVVSAMCKHLSESLRYIVSSPYQHVSLAQELEHTRHYLSLVQQNYEDDLIWSIEASEAIAHIQLPRLVIQPLVENCIEHAFGHTDPPWRIRVQVKAYTGLWAVEISDNGSGFEPSKIKAILEMIEQSGEGARELQGGETGIGNMGIVNTVNRLKLMYKNRLFFNIYNNPAHEGGATVQIIASLTKDFY
ncbi:histidine kinase [Paenibacillus sp. IB182496]|uniref:Histidine kinase n=1 Tax=Paenibacillus sabuli TaxID=2772509 RepID=A0A927BN78_9BACL|nr:sensor histidine kinase [Paenibacillus sabuli]MBD2843642.1 histidine kinase [Paenibacillus sabuli]